MAKTKAFQDNITPHQRRQQIIDTDTFNLVQGMLKRNQRSGGKYSTNKYNAVPAQKSSVYNFCK